MGLIFCGSSDSQSFQRSSRIIRPVLLWLFPRISEESVHTAIVAVRKGAHLAEYAILGLLLWRALRAARQEGPWTWSQALQAVAFVALFAASDEFHQSFVPSREASIVDVLIDTMGAVLVLLFLWVVGRWRQVW
jgi:VanZ family protein